MIARAAELEEESGVGGGGGLDEQALLEIGEDVGLSPDLVRVALDEYSAGMLGRRERRTLIGPRALVFERTLPGSLEQVDAMVSGYLASQLFERWRRSTSRAVWRPREGVIASVQRTVKKLARGKVLADVTEITVGMVEVPGAEGQHPTVRVRFEVEAGGLRQGLVATAIGGSVLGGIGAVAATGVAISMGDPTPLLGVPAGGALAAATYYLPRHSYLHKLKEIEFFLQSGMDDLESSSARR